MVAVLLGISQSHAASLESTPTEVLEAVGAVAYARPGADRDAIRASEEAVLALMSPPGQGWTVSRQIVLDESVDPNLRVHLFSLLKKSGGLNSAVAQELLRQAGDGKYRHVALDMLLCCPEARSTYREATARVIKEFLASDPPMGRPCVILRAPDFADREMVDLLNHIARHDDSETTRALALRKAQQAEERMRSEDCAQSDSHPAQGRPGADVRSDALALYFGAVVGGVVLAVVGFMIVRRRRRSGA